jgi:hypothetical protein
MRLTQVQASQVARDDHALSGRYVAGQRPGPWRLLTVRNTIGLVLLQDRAGVRCDRVLIRAWHTLIRKDEGEAGAGGRRPDGAADGLAGVGSGAVTSIRWMP